MDIKHNGQWKIAENKVHTFFWNLVCNSLLLDIQRRKQNWCSSVEYLLDTHGFSYVWENPYAVNLKAFHTDFKIRVVDIFKQNWYNNIMNSSSLHLYKEFKMTFEF